MFSSVFIFCIPSQLEFVQRTADIGEESRNRLVSVAVKGSTSVSQIMTAVCSSELVVCCWITNEFYGCYHFFYVLSFLILSVFLSFLLFLFLSVTCLLKNCCHFYDILYGSILIDNQLNNFGYVACKIYTFF